MGIISIEKAQRLFWLGRYIERAMTSLKTFHEYHDIMLDEDYERFRTFCDKLGIPDDYADSADFHERYVYSPDNPYSIRSNLENAYDNAIVLRSEIGSETLSYLEIALSRISTHRKSRGNYFTEQRVLDYLLAFWGCADDTIISEESRSIMKSGKYIERLDLYMRFGKSIEEIQREFTKLSVRLSRLYMPYNDRAYKELERIYEKNDQWKDDYDKAFIQLSSIFNQL